jgi:hypothetical protein
LDPRVKPEGDKEGEAEGVKEGEPGDDEERELKDV